MSEDETPVASGRRVTFDVPDGFTGVSQLVPHGWRLVMELKPPLNAEALRELSEAATPGTWRNGDDDHPKPRYILVEDRRDGRGVRLEVGDFQGANADADATFIVAAVNYVRSLLPDANE